MKFGYIILAIVIASIASIIYGFTIQELEIAKGNKFIGIGTVGIFLIAMPIFLIKESKGKSMQKYMLTKENIEKMKAKAVKNNKIK